jgi:hypothetical protein
MSIESFLGSMILTSRSKSSKTRVKDSKNTIIVIESQILTLCSIRIEMLPLHLISS